MGVIPGGRGNDFARVVGHPDRDPSGRRLLLAGGTRADRRGRGERPPLPLHRELRVRLRRQPDRQRGAAREGNLVYAYAALRALAAWRPARFELELDGERHEVRGYSVAAANSKAYGGGMFLAPDAELDDGQLDVVSVGEVGKLRYLANLPKVFKGAHLGHEEVTVRRAAEVRIAADRPLEVYADGDHIADLPATIRVLPRALNVIAP